MGYISDIRKYVGHEAILTAGVGLFVFNSDNKVLMQLRTDYNLWGFPGGAMELGESFEETAKRELKEETNLEIDDMKLIKVLSGKDTYREYPNGDKLYDITAVFVIKKYHGELKVNDDESRKLEWFDIDNLPDNMTDHTKNYLYKFGNILEEALDEFKKTGGNMDNILITSSGFNTVNNYVSDENINLFKEISNGKRVIIIANAAPYGTGNYVARENVKENFLKVGAKEVDIVDLDKDNVNIILDYDIIYVLGGNITNLIELNKDTNFKEVLIKFLEKGLYIGESAGSMILGNDLKYIYDLKKGTKPKYDVILDSYEGLGLVDMYLYPHYQKTKEDMQEKVNNYELEKGIKITRLNDGEIISYNYTN